MERTWVFDDLIELLSFPETAFAWKAMWDNVFSSLFYSLLIWVLLHQRHPNLYERFSPYVLRRISKKNEEGIHFLSWDSPLFKGTSTDYEKLSIIPLQISSLGWYNRNLVELLSLLSCEKIAIVTGLRSWKAFFIYLWNPEFSWHSWNEYFWWRRTGGILVLSLPSLWGTLFLLPTDPSTLAPVTPSPYPPGGSFPGALAQPRQAGTLTHTMTNP